MQNVRAGDPAARPGHRKLEVRPGAVGHDGWQHEKLMKAPGGMAGSHRGSRAKLHKEMLGGTVGLALL